MGRVWSSIRPGSTNTAALIVPERLSPGTRAGVIGDVTGAYEVDIVFTADGETRTYPECQPAVIAEALHAKGSPCGIAQGRLLSTRSRWFARKVPSGSERSACMIHTPRPNTRGRPAAFWSSLPSRLI
ncbi:MAG: hypothetical protein NVS1B4_09510 [Gemmatimonadaceae bacterium]